ncbi:MAG: GNAT family N-acetyltransferase [Acaryochloridaceae cyanobacterium SU_2_1]|nr:GNAT family N-acetyltransferase [Acaryochloridaceae cyanobacterium SU_2_1]
MVWSARLDPTQLRWTQFWVIECQTRMIACGQLRSFAQAQELGSLIVDPDWRGQGLGSYLTNHLIQRASEPLYLECLGQQLRQFYHQRGFDTVSWSALPASLQRKFGLSQLAKTLVRLPIYFMKYQA